MKHIMKLSATHVKIAQELHEQRSYMIECGAMQRRMMALALTRVPKPEVLPQTWEAGEEEEPELQSGSQQPPPPTGGGDNESEFDFDVL